MQYKASDWGHRFHQLLVHEALGAGAAGPGKSLVLLMDPVQQIQVEHCRCTGEYPDSWDRSLVDYLHKHPLRWGESYGWALHIRREFKNLDQTIRRSMRIFPNIDPSADFHKASSTWTFKSGYRYQFGHCKDPDDWLGYASNEYSYIGYDELVELDKDQYDGINTRLRSGDPVMRQMKKIRAMSNPVFKRTADSNIAVRDPHWVRNYFVKPAREGNTIIRKKVTRPDGSHFFKTRIYMPATLYDNPDKGFVRDYEMQLADKPPHIRRALLYGDWWVTPGSFYGEDWLEELHVISPFEIPRDWPRWRSMDWGFKSPGCIHWWAADYDGNIYCTDELTFQGKTDIEVAKIVKQRELDMGLWKEGRSLITGPADTQLWEERGDSAKTKAEVFAENGVHWLQADKRSRASNAQRFMRRLKDHEGGTRLPGIMFFRNCVRAIETIPAIQADPNDPECPVKGGDDHWHDSVVYSCAYVSRGTDSMNAPGDDDDVEEEKTTSDRGRYGYGQVAC